MEFKEIIKTLRKDDEYYDGIGKKYLSNSNIETLLKNPKQYGVPEQKTVAMLIGNAVHEITFFGSTNLPSIDVSSRNTKAYKDRDVDGPVLLQKELDECHRIAETLRKTKAAEVLFEDANMYEEPMVKDLFGNGVLWKGKADIISPVVNKIIDLKTTSNIDAFASKARMYNYDSQAWIYKQLFDLDMMFFVIEKDTMRMKQIEVSDETLEKGKMKAIEAEQNYLDMFVNKNVDPAQYVEYGII